VEVTFKIVAFWGHERIWARIRWGRGHDDIAVGGIRRWFRARLARPTRESVPAP
jgi:hypothetical protein